MLRAVQVKQDNMSLLWGACNLSRQTMQNALGEPRGELCLSLFHLFVLGDGEAMLFLLLESVLQKEWCRKSESSACGLNGEVLDQKCVNGLQRDISVEKKRMVGWVEHQYTSSQENEWGDREAVELLKIIELGGVRIMMPQYLRSSKKIWILLYWLIVFGLWFLLEIK